MTKEQLAEKLNGRAIGKELNRDEAADAKKEGLVIVFGYSDDNVEFRGAIRDEVGCYDKRKYTLDKEGVLPDWEYNEEKTKEDAADYFRRFKPSLPTITAFFGADPNISWTFKTDIPHATFDIMEDGDVFCRGIVFSIEGL